MDRMLVNEFAYKYPEETPSFQFYSVPFYLYSILPMRSPIFIFPTIRDTESIPIAEQDHFSQMPNIDITLYTHIHEAKTLNSIQLLR